MAHHRITSSYEDGRDFSMPCIVKAKTLLQGSCSPLNTVEEDFKSVLVSEGVYSIMINAGDIQSCHENWRMSTSSATIVHYASAAGYSFSKKETVGDESVLCVVANPTLFAGGFALISRDG
ncbi:hypothetical protein VNO77_03823 [Canavalia gladiata]|uniref:Uncharacterized protein n=1 Tax=Canavalia gladiata TaxID=3824 RepID=A0AAN9R765_CANGL